MGSFVQSRFHNHSRFAEDFSPSDTELLKWDLLASRYDAWLEQKAAPVPAIPRILHQIWIGSPLPIAYKEMADTWKKLHPDWGYVLWDDERILGLGSFPARNIYQKAKSYGVKSDLARYEILRQFGGVYADTDFECVRPMDELLAKSTFFAGVIFGNDPGLANGLIACVPGHPITKELCERTAEIGKLSTEIMDIINQTGPGLLTRVFFDSVNSLETSDVALPSQYFYPYPNFKKRDDISRQEVHSYLSEQSFAIHYWDVSWSKVDFWSWLVRKFNRLLRKMGLRT